MAGERAALMATDPPYLVDYDGGTPPRHRGQRRQARRGPDKHWDAYIDHEHSVAFYADFLQGGHRRGARPTPPPSTSGSAIMRTEVIWQAWREVGLLPHQVLIWKKTPRRAHLQPTTCGTTSRCMYGWPRASCRRAGRRPTPRAVWEIESARSRTAPAGIHPTQKPVETRAPADRATTRIPGELHLRALLGLAARRSIAAEQTGRRLLRHRARPGLRRRRRAALGGASRPGRRCDMARSTKAEVARRVAEIFPLVCDCMTLREIRACVIAKTSWGPRHLRRAAEALPGRGAAAQMREAARYDREQEFGAARRRLERVIARAAAKGELRTVLTANRSSASCSAWSAPAVSSSAAPTGAARASRPRRWRRSSMRSSRPRPTRARTRRRSHE